MQVEIEPESPAEIRTKHSKLKLSIPTEFTFKMFYINHGLCIYKQKIEHTFVQVNGKINDLCQAGLIVSPFSEELHPDF